jgi:glycosyltransferase involved in cell wall biosynthesis
MPPLVSVVTLTRARPDRLLCAIDSVAAQRGVAVEHIVLGDACPEIGDPLIRDELANQYSHLTIRNVPRTQKVSYLPARLAQLRNIGVRLASAEYIAQLDDDNAYEPDHLRSLLDALHGMAGAEAAHSWRRLFDRHGEPYTPAGHDPWHPQADADGGSFAALCQLGILAPGSNLVRDRLDTAGAAVPRVDTSEFLATRRLHLRCPWETSFSRGAQRLGFTEDVAFSVALVRRGIRVAQSEQPTLRYHMGGYSNDSGGIDSTGAPRVAG